MDRFDTALPPQFTDRVREAARRDTLSHAIILTGGGDLIAAARFIAMAMECEGDAPPCGVCRPCRKAAGDIHPDIITVRDEEHKLLSAEVVRAVRADAFILPNEGRRKVYIFPDCALLDARTQNLLLKVLEDGPAHAAFLLCAANSGVLLPTIRSRCILLHLEGEDAAAGPDGRAGELAGLLRRRDRVGVSAYFARLEQSKAKREEVQALVCQARDLLAGALSEYYRTQNPPPGTLEARRTMAVCDVLDKFQRQLRFNLGVGHVCGALAVELTALL